MRRLRRANALTISLFSFQDIITSVTAILILMVLILTLELIARLQRAGASAADFRSAEDLRSALVRLEQSLESLEIELSERTREVEFVADLSPADIEAAIEDRAQEASQLESAIAVLVRQAEHASAARRKAELRLVDVDKRVMEVDGLLREAEEMAVATSALVERNESVARRIEECEQRGRGRAHLPSTLVFNESPSGAPRPRLIEVSRAGVRVLGEQSGGDALFDWPASGLAPGFLRWLSGLRIEREYVVVVLRPSGLPWYMGVREAIAEKSLAMGLELIDEAMTVIVKR